MSNAKKEKLTSKGSNSQLRYVHCSMQGWRNTMEDDFVCSVNELPDNVSLFVVFDGHGGKEVA